ncbi:membrane-bound transglycosylase [Pseudarthrobacter chlorophenolicus A6]|uniref:Membrane-bound transglycosylase n=1 Tax=Pseudarthrobacter chlorophenolicus (strain ATCC 700700 / DSM 12829 / CIP 107037 / JCM 12360 / KCTC 9906 / NCIMB 13794 / A6) TaxID=452863 RepID=B8H9G7_PSECP|nr:membrane-bound transglycosylase [Pseudarthrobacter chlorophenolicus]ACL40036.1 membrane-bound transglycosylase [Pseudarthrobacter chlorophenolicus A6]SDQ89135.1 Septal ring factor EnvC, activator of murein hydrolases AmiA and AmiB [Pseudarthrobacter chlorophenolicus]
MPLFVTKLKSPALGGLLVFALLGPAALVPASAADRPPEGYPSWEDVRQARESEAGTAAEITRIGNLLSDLQADSETLGGAAVTAAADYAAAEAALTAATNRVEALAAQSAAANGELQAHRREIGALAVQSYKTGATTAGFFMALDALEAGNVHGLNMVELVGAKTAGLVDRAASAAKVASSLGEQEKAARSQRENLAKEAGARLAGARSAQDAVARHISEEQQRGGELTAQLASLKGTTAAVEGEFRQGQAALAAYEVSQAAKRAAAREQAQRDSDRAAKAAADARVNVPPPAPATPPGAAGPAPAVPGPVKPAPADPAPAPAPPAQPVPPPVVVPSVPGGAVNDPAGAKNYAAGRLGAYGWGQDQFLCLAQLWTKESNWQTTATNPYSGAYGIPQALPPGKYASAGSDWLTSYRTQIEWGLGYIRDRYGSPCRAWSHSMANNWY